MRLQLGGWVPPGDRRGHTWKALSSWSLSTWSMSWSESLKMRVRAWAHLGISCGDSGSTPHRSLLLALPTSTFSPPAWPQGHRGEQWGVARPSVRSRTALRCFSGSSPSTGTRGNRLRGGGREDPCPCLCGPGTPGALPAHLHTGLDLGELAHDGQHSLHGAPRPQVRLVAHQDNGDPWGRDPRSPRIRELAGPSPPPRALPITWVPSWYPHSPVGSIWFGSER